MTARPLPPAGGSSPALSRVLARLTGVVGSGRQFRARCPAHDDRSPSLSVALGRDGRVLVTCHAGCALDDILAALGLGTADLFDDGYAPTVATRPLPVAPLAPERHADRDTLVKTYDYVDEAGALLYQVCRYVRPDGSKTFRQRRPDGSGGWIYSMDGVRRVLYKLPVVIEAAASGRQVFVVEGEKDCDTLAETSNVATTSPMGAGKWSDEYARHVKGAEVVVIPDNDEAGRAHAETVAASCHAAGAATVRVVDLPGLPEHGDVTDWFGLGHDEDELADLIGRARLWSPDPSSRTRWRLDELLYNDDVMRPPEPVAARLAWRGRSTLLAASEKSGKSTLIGYLAARVSRGQDFLGDPANGGAPGVVLLVGPEEFVGDQARRLRHFGADPARVHLVDKLPADPRERLGAVLAHVEAVTPDLIVIDTLMAYARGMMTDASASAQMQPVVQGLTDVAHGSHAALVVVHHARKSDGHYRDSSAIGGAVDVIAEMFSPNPKDDPTLRQLRVVGRVPAHGCSFRYNGQDYVVDGAEAPLDVRILSLVRGRPGCSVNVVCDGVAGRRDEIIKTIHLLLTQGKLDDLNRGSSPHRRLVVPGARPATLPFDRPSDDVGGPE